MADFRRWILALAVLTLFAGLANAQLGTGGGTMTCSAQGASNPQIRNEGATELTGDIKITCVGGDPGPDGTQAPPVNIQVSLPAPVTSRLASSAGVSDAMLIIDDAGSNTGGVIPNFGPNAPLIPCQNPGPTGTIGCAAFSYHVAVGGVPFVIASAIGPPTGPGAANAPNIYQGVANGNTVTFYGIPIVAPGSNGSRVFRITNVRINATGLGQGPISANVISSNPAALLISNAQPFVGQVAISLAPSVTSNNFAQCVSQTFANAGVLTYSEANGQGVAFKTRVDPTVPLQVAPAGLTKGQGSALVQNVPGNIYNSETGFTPNVTFTVGGATATPGLADFGTRVQATFSNVPAGATVYVSLSNVTVTGGVAVAPVVLGAPAFALLVTGGPTAAELAAAPTSTVTVPVGTSGVTTAIPVVAVTVSGGTGQAVWEVISSTNAIDTLQFGVWVSYTANPGQNIPAVGATTTVDMSYAPASTGGAGTTIPRFAEKNPAAPNNVFAISACQTVLLFPFLTSLGGFDTGVAISNTSADPFATVGQVGACTLNWYGIGSPTPKTPFPPTGTIAAGGTATGIVSVMNPGFQGYVIAQCGFQYAHGFAFITDLGARNLAMGYLALVIPDPSLHSPTNTRPPTPFPCTSGIGACQTTGEQLGQ